MTGYTLKEIIEEFRGTVEILGKLGGVYLRNFKDVIGIHNDVVLYLQELEEYRAIGTVEELKALKEKEEPKKPNVEPEDMSKLKF